jgi:hypothetical protein
MTNDEKKAIEDELKEATQELTAFGSNTRFHPDNLEVSRGMQDRVVRLSRMINKRTKKV